MRRRSLNHSVHPHFHACRFRFRGGRATVTVMNEEFERGMAVRKANTAFAIARRVLAEQSTSEADGGR